mmetsp:Transcript_25362/g.45759  ORF Transcript_25362/g.45759 Transcript_25362/m.45759 type:complete len:804 (-) Transcript_25362:253-2664(-)
MSESFKTTEDELNFILGNDNDGPLFDIDASLVHDHDDGDNDLDLAASLKLIPPPPLPPPTATAIATSTTASSPSSRDDDEADDSWAAVGGSVTTIIMTDDDNGDGMESYAATDGDPNDVISRMVALSPTFSFDDAQVVNGNQRGQGGDSSSNNNGNAFNDSLMMSDFLTRFEENTNDASSTDIINDGNGLLDGAFGDSFHAAASGSGGSGLGSAFSDSLNAAVIASLNGGNDALSRVLGDSIMMDPTQARDSFAPTLQGDHGGDGDDPLANFANCHPVELEDFGDFNFDDMIAPQSLMMNGTSDNNDYYEPTPPPSSSLRLNPQDHSFHLSLHNNLPIHHEQLLQKQDVMTQEVPLLQQEQSSNILPPPYSFAVSAASKNNVIAHKGVAKTTINGGRPITTTTCHNNFPPIIHPAPKSSMPNNTRPIRKRRIAVKLPGHRAFQQFGKRQQQRPKGGSTPTTTSSSSSPSSSSSSSRKGSPPSRIKQVRPVDPIKARLARGKRRRLRARSQAIELVGGGDVAEIERRAVADSDLNNDNDYDAAAANNRNSDDRNRTTTTTRRSVLLAEFSRNFDVEMFVDATFEKVYDVMVEADERADEAAENRGSSAVPFSSKAGPCCNGPHPMEATSNSTISNRAVKSPNNDKNTGRSPKPIPSTAASKAKSPSSSSLAASAVVTPPTRDKATLKTLPSGKDPESRKLRRLMRNRLSAQASRDRRKKAIEDAQRSTAMKKVEIKRLEKTLEEEKQRMLLLERAVGYARDYLGRERYAKVAGKVSCSSSRAPVGGGSQGESGRVAVSNAIQSN